MSATATSRAYPLTRVQLYHGYQEEEGAGSTLAASWGFAATNPVPEVRTTFIGADGQSNFGEPASTFNGVAVPAADWDGTDPQTGGRFPIGNLWDTDTASVGKLVAPGDIGATIRVTGGPDCLVWVVIHPLAPAGEEAALREKALAALARDHADEDKVGSLEMGKLADLVVVDTDLLTCPVDAIKDTQALRTYLNGKVVYERIK